MSAGNTSLLKRTLIQQVQFKEDSSWRGLFRSQNFPTGWKQQWHLECRPNNTYCCYLKSAQATASSADFTVALYYRHFSRSVPWSIKSTEVKIDLDFSLLDMFKQTYYIVVSITETNLSPVAQEQKLFQEQFKNLLDQGFGSDVTIATKDGELAAHWAVLAARSPFFRAILENDCKEKRDNKIELNVARGTAEKMLKFIYSGEVDIISNEEGQALLEVSDMYLIPGLKYEAERFLGNTITEKNVFDLVFLSDLCKANLLKQAAFRYIRQNCQSVTENGQFLDVLKRPELATALFRDVCSLKK